MSRKPTGKPRGRPALPPDLRRVSMALWILARHAELIRAHAARQGITPGQVVDGWASANAIPRVSNRVSNQLMPFVELVTPWKEITPKQWREVASMCLTRARNMEITFTVKVPT